MARGGYIPSEFDGRDVEEHHVAEPSAGAQPWSVSLPRPTLWNQGTEVDCCASIALVGAMEITSRNHATHATLSPLFHYYYARGTRRALGPVRLRTALQVAAARGVCTAELHNPALTKEGALLAPTEVARANARRHRLLAYDPNSGIVGYSAVHRGDRVARWKGALRGGRPVIVGFWTQDSYWRGEGMKVSAIEPHRGAHAALLVAFDDETSSFRVFDSRGAGFGDGGEWDLSYSVARTDRIAESWTIQGITAQDSSA
jgi:hypothetical protein